MSDDEEAFSIHAAGNTYNPCLIALRERGWKLRAENAGDQLIWSAKKDGVTCSASTPPELLGIATLAETYGKDWQRRGPDIFDQVIKAGDNHWV